MVHPNSFSNLNQADFGTAELVQKLFVGFEARIATVEVTLETPIQIASYFGNLENLGDHRWVFSLGPESILVGSNRILFISFQSSWCLVLNFILKITLFYFFKHAVILYIRSF